MIELDKYKTIQTIVVGSIKKKVEVEEFVNMFAMEKHFGHKDQSRLMIHLLKSRKELVSLDFDKLHRNLNFLELYYALNTRR